MPNEQCPAFASLFIGYSSLIKGVCKKCRLVNCQITSNPPDEASIRLAIAVVSIADVVGAGGSWANG